MKKPVMILLAALGLVVWGPSSAQQIQLKVQTLRGADAAATDQAPDERRYVGKDPGSQQPIARTFSTQPPLIPHTVENLDQVTLAQNPCLACHGPENYKNVKAPKIGDSHFKDRDGKTLSQMSPSRYQCTGCHVPQADAKPLVENTFRGDAQVTGQKRK